MRYTAIIAALSCSLLALSGCKQETNVPAPEATTTTTTVVPVPGPTATEVVGVPVPGPTSTQVIGVPVPGATVTETATPRPTTSPN